jgi:glycosyltransferase involved in cell wall biosynthesis
MRTPENSSAPSSSGRATISVAMIARNEEANLPRTLESVRWVDEIVIVDSGSSDRTPEIARSFGAKHIFNREFRGHPEQKNIAIDRCTSDWILLLDADEVVSPELGEEVKRVLAHPQYAAYWIPRLNLFMTRWLRHGGFYPDRKLRLFKRGATRVEEGVGPHGTPQFKGETGVLRGNLMHYAYPTLDIYLEHMNRYSSEASEFLVVRGKTSHSAFAFAWNAVLNPMATFLKNYIFRLGFMDGPEGFLLHLNHSLYIHWKYVKAWEIGKFGKPDSSVEKEKEAGLRARSIL